MYNGKSQIKARTWRREAKDDQSYGFATGRLRVLEQFMLTHEDLVLFSDRTTDLHVLHDILDNAEYPAADKLDLRFSLEERKVDHEIIEVAPASQLPRVLLLEKDYHNAKWILKQVLLSARAEEGKEAHAAKFGEQLSDLDDEDIDLSFEQLLDRAESLQDKEARDAVQHAEVLAKPDGIPIDTKLFNTEALLRAASTVQGRDGKGISEHIAENLIPARIDHERLWEEILSVMRGERLVKPSDEYLIEAIKRTVKAYLAYRDLSLVDIVLDKAYYEELMAIGQDPNTGSEREFILDFCSLKADAVNYQILCRAALSKTGVAYLRQVLVPCGEVSFSLLKRCYPAAVTILHGAADDQTAIQKALTQIEVAYQNSMAKGLVKSILRYKDIAGIRALGRDIDNLLIDLARKGKRQSYGAEVVAGYWFAKQMEVKNLRIMYASRDIDIPFDTTMALLRKLYREND